MLDKGIEYTLELYNNYKEINQNMSIFRNETLEFLKKIFFE